MTYIYFEPTSANGYFHVTVHTTWNRKVHALFDAGKVEALKSRIMSLGQNVRIEGWGQVTRYSFTG